MKHILSLALTCVFIVTCMQSQTIYYTGFGKPSKQAEWTQYSKGIQTLYHNWVIDSGFYDPSKCLAHGYPVGDT